MGLERLVFGLRFVCLFWGYLFVFLRPLFRVLDLAIIKRGEGRKEQKRDCNKQLSFTKSNFFKN